MYSSLRSASRFSRLNLVIPAASSNTTRRSSGFDDRIWSICPCAMIEYAVRPIPVSANRSWMSLSRHNIPLIRYSPRPSRNTRRVIATSLNSTRSASSHSPSVSVTSAIPSGLRFSVPLKITSAISPPRSALAEVSPNTHRIASTTFDLPQPFGPTIPVTPR